MFSPIPSLVRSDWIKIAASGALLRERALGKGPAHRPQRCWESLSRTPEELERQRRALEGLDAAKLNPG